MSLVKTYSLVDKDSDTFYSSLSIFTDVVLDSVNKKISNVIIDYSNWVDKNHIEKLRTHEEYTLEFIMLGIFWNNYISKAVQTGKLAKSILAKLYFLRKKYPAYKSQIDKLRGFLSYIFLEKRNRFRIEVYSIENFSSLLDWLKATGEFNEEVLRLSNWLLYFKEQSSTVVTGNLIMIKDCAISFTDIGRSMLGSYTRNVDNFRGRSRNDYKYREDYFFVQRMENEYFLNMFGAEVMNRELKGSFSKVKHRAILLPVCMRKNSDEECKAVADTKGRVCAVCNAGCNIGRIAKEGNKKNAKVYLISHSSSFSEFLNKWADQNETGLVGVACVLNLLTGGYEMKRLNIASQCIFLDYCSCKKHWNKEGDPTNLDQNKLKQLFVVNQEYCADN